MEMKLNAGNLRFILGLKLKTLRQKHGLSLKELSLRSGLSVSYLSEIEKGKKYPKPDKLLALAPALETTYDELVSLKVNEALVPLKSLFSSSFVQEFPFDLFGLEPEDLFGLVTDEPDKAGALIQTFLEIGRTYDVRVEHFLFAALRSYQQLQGNYFPDLEEAAVRFRASHAWGAWPPPDELALRSVLENEFGYRIEETRFMENPALRRLRSVFVPGKHPTLLVNAKLMSSQKAFIFARELGFLTLRLKDRAATSSRLQVNSFDQVLNTFKASYFAGALLIDQDLLLADFRAFFGNKAWDDHALLSLMSRYRASPEMFLYRVTELAPRLFDLGALFFMRFNHDHQTDTFTLTKVLNMSGVSVPHGIWHNEHYCRRWPVFRLLAELEQRQAQDLIDDPLVQAHRIHFIDQEATFFTITCARALSLKEHTNTAVSLGFLMTDTFNRNVRFGRDPAVGSTDVNLTCERCSLSADACQDRVAAPLVFQEQQALLLKEEALARLIQTVKRA